MREKLNKHDFAYSSIRKISKIDFTLFRSMTNFRLGHDGINMEGVKEEWIFYRISWISKSFCQN